MKEREEEMIDIIWDRMTQLSNAHILAEEHKDRLGVISFYIDNLHYNLGVKILNDRFGIQTRGGCSCAGTYGHYLFGVGESLSDQITSEINQGNCSTKPGWIRMSIHPTMTNEEVVYIMDAIESVANNHTEWSKDYKFDLISGSVKYKEEKYAMSVKQEVDECFELAFS